ncbi:hypothetical protein ARHIZOSPH14_04480 [Agromyces rhizosphaerae]|uniref:HTH tetR-type domain-containing protein n=2 Tax=Agromyces rhizosphaerae TaxID=88374 RepID=A0A9W6FN76_9MICO|nr:hypothetical protein ARHIZOSPH14_04480 [Agromyces rhizosphaerae]
MPLRATNAGGRRARTRQRLMDAALELFERQGYDATTAAQIAAAAGVSEMTFFRHFASKERALVDDPYDPVIARQVAEAPGHLPPLVRATTGVRVAWSALPEPETDEVRRRLRIAARTPSLQAAMRGNAVATEDAIVEALCTPADGPGTDPAVARIAAAAVMAALLASLLAWADADEGGLGEAVLGALDVLEQRPEARR